MEMAKWFSALGIAGFLGFVGLVGSWEAEYSRLTTCTNIQHEVATFTDNSGHDWKWDIEAGEYFEVGNVYRLIMDNNHTPHNMFDDTIKKIKKN